MTISIVVPVFNEEPLIKKFFDAIHTTFLGLPENYELVFVDDGSEDGTWNEIRKLCDKSDQVTGVRLLKNFGKENALTAGLANATGEAHIPMDVDFQDPVELVPTLIDEWKKGSAHVVAVRRSRDDGRFRNFVSQSFYRVMSRLGQSSDAENIGDFRLIDASITKNLLKLPEFRRYNKGLFALVSPAPVKVFFDRSKSVRKGPPRQVLTKLIDLALIATSYRSDKLVTYTLFLGATVFVGALITILLAAILWLLGVIAVPGQATTIVIGALIIGFQALSFGGLGFLLIEILAESKRRPLFIVDEVHGASVNARKSENGGG